MTIAVNRDRPFSDGLDQKMCDPALVLVSELPRAVDTAHPQHHRPQLEDALIIADILVRHPLRTAVRAVEIKRSVFSHPVKKAPFIRHVAAIGAMHIGSIEQLAVNLVGRRKYDGSMWIAPSYRFEDVQRSAAVDLEIRSWII